MWMDGEMFGLLVNEVCVERVAVGPKIWSASKLRAARGNYLLRQSLFLPKFLNRRSLCTFSCILPILVLQPQSTDWYRFLFFFFSARNSISFRQDGRKKRTAPPEKKMHLMYTEDPATGKRVYTLKKVLDGVVTKSAHPARFSPDDKYSRYGRDRAGASSGSISNPVGRHRVTLKKRYGLLLTQQSAFAFLIPPFAQTFEC